MTSIASAAGRSSLPRMVLLLAVLMTMFVGATVAAAPAAEARAPDYCGQDDWTRAVPDLPGSYDFRQACFNHDTCRTNYADTYNNAMYCHGQFRNDMESWCWEYLYDPNGDNQFLIECQDYAGDYYNGVVLFNTPPS